MNDEWIRRQIEAGMRGPTWVKTSLVAEMLGIKTQTLEKWRAAGKGPVFRKFSHKMVRYDLAQVQAWMTDQGQA